jgi:large subunit ribosomal protein L21
MYAVIRAGGKQYRVAPGDVIKVEKLAPADNGSVEFSDVLAVSSEQGKIGGATGDTRVVGQVVGEGRGDKILVFHYKRKKQYKKLQGHRQDFTAVRITSISVDGQTFDAPAVEAKPKRVKNAPKAEVGGAASAAAPKKATKKAAGGSAKASAPKKAAKPKVKK